MRRDTYTDYAGLGEIREEKGFTQMALASAIGVHVRVLQNWESNGSQPNLRNAALLAGALGVPMETIVGVFADQNLRDALKALAKKIH